VYHAAIEYSLVIDLCMAIPTPPTRRGNFLIENEKQIVNCVVIFLTIISID
jgi:hypothetical protein